MKVFRKRVFIDTQFKNVWTCNDEWNYYLWKFIRLQSIINDDESLFQHLTRQWRNNQFIKKNWISISIISSAKSNASKVYSLKVKNRILINKNFNRLHVENKMSWTMNFTFYDYLIFVIWKTIHTLNKFSKRKDKVVIDIKNLNKIFMFDEYSIILQIDMIAIVINSLYISLMNVVNFFHQWFVRVTNRHKLIVISHKKSEQWNVTIMSYRNSSTYVQRQINIILRKYRHFVKAYVDDIVIFFNSLKKHFRHLMQIFALFKKYNIVIKTSKIYLNYSFIVLLN